MQRISVGALSTRKAVAEHNWSIRCIRNIVAHTPLFAVTPVVLILKTLGMCVQSWPIWWRFIAQDALPETPQFQSNSLSTESKRGNKILHSLGKAPKNLDIMGDFKYRLPFWWVLATRANKNVLNWARRAGINFHHRRDGVGFLYACLASQNNEALEWALKCGIPANDIDTRGNSLLAFALRRNSPDEPEVINMLISYGASWYYKGSLGENGEDVLKQSPEWTRWHLMQSVCDAQPKVRSSRKM